MDGPQANSNVELVYSDDHGATWSSPVNVVSGGGGDKDILLADRSGGVLIAYEHLSSAYVAYSPNPATTGFTHTKVSPPSDAGNGTSLATGGTRDSHGNAYIVWTDVTNNSKRDSYLWLARSSDNFTTYTTSLIDRSYAANVNVGAGWDYWGASVQIAAIPKAGNDRLVVIYNAGTSAGAAERSYTKYSDTLGASWNIPFSASVYPNGTELSTAPVGAWHGFPSIAATSAGVKVMWQDNRVQYPCTSSTTAGACGLFNNYTRMSVDGVTWTSAGARSIVFVLDDITAPRLDGGPERGFDVAVDRGLLHCLPRDRWPAYATGVTGLVAPGGTLLVVAHEPGTLLGTTPVTIDDLRALLPSFELVRATPTTLAGAAAQLFDLERRADSQVSR